MGLFNLFGHNDAERWNQEVYNTPQYEPHKHESSWTHEAIAGAAGFEAMKAYENHLRNTGQEPSHPLMKEILAGFAAAEVDKLAETKGLDFLDREKAKRHAVEQAHHLANERYGYESNGVDYVRQQPGPGYGGYNPGGYGAPQPGNYGGYDGQGGYGVNQVGMGNYGGPPPEMAYGGPQGQYDGGYGGPPPGQYGGGYGGPPPGQYGGGYQGGEEHHHHHHHHHHRD